MKSGEVYIQKSTGHRVIILTKIEGTDKWNYLFIRYKSMDNKLPDCFLSYSPAKNIRDWGEKVKPCRR